MSNSNLKGVGVGFRDRHFDDILEQDHGIKWFELLTENHLTVDSIAFYQAEKIREDFPVTLHGVGMSLGSTDPLNQDYMKKLKVLISRIQPELVSDHLAWVSHEGVYGHELLPLPYNEETLQHLVCRISQAQELLGRTLVIENPSSYLSFAHSEMSEAEFLTQLVKMSGCDLLLDINNLYISATNLGFDALDYLQALDANKIKQIHLAGYDVQAGGEGTQFLFDTHGFPVREPVWQLYEKAVSLYGRIPTLIEWDTDIPAFNTLVQEAERAQNRLDSATRTELLEGHGAKRREIEKNEFRVA
ncbi:MAG: DUF692 domain-containing protein [Pseudomonadales bacterium]|nr:DUF692 domain-containing protein [Pseudomonadales bacterium]